ncbi:MAG: ABC transporter ATP-binding protein [Deltaproteobacteria bacterium]|nr:ABC transporter ATP-binding protein [Deltaproteobacteria bacterium]
MLNPLQRRLALSSRGARDFVKGTLCTAFLNFSLMLPAVYVFVFLDEYLRKILEPESAILNGLGYYIFLSIAFMTTTWLVAISQYRSTFTAIYKESANRRLSLAEKLRKLPLAFFGEKNLSDLTSTIMNDNTDLEHTFSHAVPQLFASMVTLLVIFVALFFYQPVLSAALFWPVPFAGALIILSRNRQMKSNAFIYDKKRVVSEHIQEGLDTIHEIKSYNLENMYLTSLDKKLKNYERGLIRGELATGVLVNSAHSFLKLGIVSVIVVGAMTLQNTTADIFTFLVFLLVASHIFEPINEVFNNLAALFYLDVRINRMKEMDALPLQTGRIEFNPKNFDIEFDNVSFSYNDEKQVIRNVSFIARQGQTTALIGPSGGGKSTTARLAARFWDVDHGRILLGGEDIALVDPETLLQYYAVVFQDVVLFNTTIMENIRIGKQGATDDDVIRVARMAQCESFINLLPSGYQTVIGENGGTLSGGERQRISIARALLKDAPIVILDEATASLDVENETIVQKAISELIRNKTVLVIAHRMRTIGNVDKIVVLKNGQVVESGNPEDLKYKKGAFVQMLRKQNIEAV